MNARNNAGTLTPSRNCRPRTAATRLWVAVAALRAVLVARENERLCFSMFFLETSSRSRSPVKPFGSNKTSIKLDDDDDGEAVQRRGASDEQSETGGLVSVSILLAYMHQRVLVKGTTGLDETQSVDGATDENSFSQELFYRCCCPRRHCRRRRRHLLRLFAAARRRRRFRRHISRHRSDVFYFGCKSDVWLADRATDSVVGRLAGWLAYTCQSERAVATVTPTTAFFHALWSCNQLSTLERETLQQHFARSFVVLTRYIFGKGPRDPCAVSLSLYLSISLNLSPPLPCLSHFLPLYSSRTGDGVEASCVLMQPSLHCLQLHSPPRREFLPQRPSPSCIGVELPLIGQRGRGRGLELGRIRIDENNARVGRRRRRFAGTAHLLFSLQAHLHVKREFQSNERWILRFPV